MYFSTHGGKGTYISKAGKGKHGKLTNYYVFYGVSNIYVINKNKKLITIGNIYLVLIGGGRTSMVFV
jgi:hypothetical protein